MAFFRKKSLNLLWKNTAKTLYLTKFKIFWQGRILIKRRVFSRVFRRRFWRRFDVILEFWTLFSFCIFSEKMRKTCRKIQCFAEFFRIISKKCFLFNIIIIYYKKLKKGFKTKIDFQISYFRNSIVFEIRKYFLAPYFKFYIF